VIARRKSTNNNYSIRRRISTIQQISIHPVIFASFLSTDGYRKQSTSAKIFMADDMAFRPYGRSNQDVQTLTASSIAPFISESNSYSNAIKRAIFWFWMDWVSRGKEASNMVSHKTIVIFKNDDIVAFYIFEKKWLPTTANSNLKISRAFVLILSS